MIGIPFPKTGLWVIMSDDIETINIRIYALL